jgi:hypothetical protein
MLHRVNRALRGGAIALVLILACSAFQQARATDFPVSGSVTVNGQSGEIPAGAKFTSPGYDASSGILSAGTFTFPITTETTVEGGLTYVLRYQMIHLNTSHGLIAADGVAAISDARFKLKVISITVAGFPMSIGTCEIEPITVELTGVATENGLHLADDQFDIPEVPAGMCGLFRDNFNDVFPGSDNNMSLVLEGDFPLPAAIPDAIFRHGFERP